MDSSPSGLDQPFRVPNDPAEAYQAYMVPTMFQPWSGELLDRAGLQRGHHVLDVACGTGVVARGAAALVGEGGTVTGLDPSPAMLGVARRLGSPEGATITWVQGRGEELPFSDDTFDIVLCQQGMQFFTDRSTAVREMLRVLVPGGRVGVAVWRGPEHQSVKGILLRGLQKRFGPGAMMPYSFGDGDQLRALFAEAGFRDIRFETVRRLMFNPSIDEFLIMTMQGASAAVPTLAQATDQERAEAARELRQEFADEIESVRIGDGMEYQMEANILVATA